MEQELLDTIENAREELAELELLVRDGFYPSVQTAAEIVSKIWQAMDEANQQQTDFDQKFDEQFGE